MTIYEDLEKENRKLKFDLRVLRSNFDALKRMTNGCCACKFDYNGDYPVSDCGFHQVWREALAFYATGDRDGGFRARAALDE